VVLLRRTNRRRIESAADLALFSSIVCIGELSTLEPRVLGKIGLSVAPEGTSRPVIITESLVGSTSPRLREAFATHGVEADIHPCLHLPVIGPNDRVVIAVDREADTEQSVDDLLELLAGVVPRPVLAVLCDSPA
jgi:hypothetical protein